MIKIMAEHGKEVRVFISNDINIISVFLCEQWASTECTATLQKGKKDSRLCNFTQNICLTASVTFCLFVMVFTT